MESHDPSKRASWLWRGFTSLFPLSFFGLVSFLCCIFFHLLVLAYLFCLHFTWRGTLLKHALAEGAETERMIPDTTSDIYLLFIMFIFRETESGEHWDGYLRVIATFGFLEFIGLGFWIVLFCFILLSGVTDTYTYIHFILPWHIISYRYIRTIPYPWSKYF